MGRARRPTSRSSDPKARHQGERGRTPAAKKAAAPVSSGPRIEITPTPGEYEQLCRDLKALRKAGAISNTAAILEAVKTAAAGGKIRALKTPKRTRGARQRSPVQQQEMELPDAEQT